MDQKHAANIVVAVLLKRLGGTVTITVDELLECGVNDFAVIKHKKGDEKDSVTLSTDSEDALAEITIKGVKKQSMKPAFEMLTRWLTGKTVYNWSAKAGRLYEKREHKKKARPPRKPKEPEEEIVYEVQGQDPSSLDG